MAAGGPPADRASEHVGERRGVELVIRASKDAAPSRESSLDSEADFRAEANLAVVIPSDRADAFQSAGIGDPSDHYRRKTIRVTGTIVREGDQVRIRATDPAPIKVVEPRRTASPGLCAIMHRDFTLIELSVGVGDANAIAPYDALRVDSFGSQRPGGANFAPADGAVRAFKDTTAAAALGALGTRAGGEPVSSDAC